MPSGLRSFIRRLTRQATNDLLRVNVQTHRLGQTVLEALHFCLGTSAVVLLGIVVSGARSLPRPAIALIILLIVAICYFLASKPMRDGRVTWGECFWWIAVVPVLIWFAVMGSLTALMFALR
jgi:hypothetical protein